MKKSQWLSILTFLWVSSAHAGQTGLFYKTEPDDPDSGGREVFYTDVQRRFSAVDYFSDIDSEASEITIQITSPPDFADGFIWSWPTMVSFSAPDEAPLAVGSYQNASSDSSSIQPGLSLGGTEFGECPGIGNFEVKEIDYDVSAHVTKRFAADFVYRCESTATTTYGSIRYNSDVPFPQGVPVAIGSDASLNSAGCFEATSMAGRNIALHVVNGTSSQTYEWSAQVEGRPTSGSCSPFFICDPLLPFPKLPVLRTLTGFGETFAFDLARVNTEQAKVVLTATDTQTGEVQEARLTACVSDSTPPTITIRSPREGEQIVGNNFFLDASVEDSVDPSPVYYAMLGIYVIEFEPDKPMRVAVPEFLRGKGEPLALKFKVKARDSSYNWAEQSVDVTVQHDMRK